MPKIALIFSTEVWKWWRKPCERAAEAAFYQALLRFAPPDVRCGAMRIGKKFATGRLLNFEHLR